MLQISFMRCNPKLDIDIFCSIIQLSLRCFTVFWWGVFKCKSCFRSILIEFKLTFSLAFVAWFQGLGWLPWGQSEASAWANVEAKSQLYLPRCKWHVWSNSVRATRMPLVYNEWTLNHVCLCVVLLFCFQIASADKKHWAAYLQSSN